MSITGGKENPSREPTSQILTAEIRKQAFQQVAITTVAMVGSAMVIAATGWALWLKDKAPEWIGAVPPGAVAAFDLNTGCPAGWQAFDDASGRFIIGAGQGSNLTHRPLRAVGGFESHKLTKDQIPPLPATIPWVGISKQDKYNAGGRDYFVLGVSDKAIDIGGVAQDFPLIPPFISLLYCKKSL